MEFEFNVGTTDRHTVRFRYTRLISTVRVDVDGDRVKRDIYWVWLPAFRRYEFEVGDSERHYVAIEMVFPRLNALFANPTCTVMVDDNPVGEYSLDAPVR